MLCHADVWGVLVEGTPVPNVFKHTMVLHEDDSGLWYTDVIARQIADDGEWEFRASFILSGEELRPCSAHWWQPGELEFTGAVRDFNGTPIREWEEK